MSSYNLAEVVAHLKRVADLRQLAAEVIPDGEAAIYLDEWHAFYLGAQPGMNAAVRRICGTRGTGGI